MSAEIKQINLKDIPEDTEIVVESKIFDGYGYGKIKHRISRSGQYMYSFLKIGDSITSVIIPNESTIERIEGHDVEQEYFIHWE